MKKVFPTTVMLVLLVISVAGCAGGLDTSSYYNPPITEYSEPNPTPTPSEIPVTDTVWSTFFGPIYEGSWVAYQLAGVNSYMLQFTGQREVKVLEVTEDTIITEQVDTINAGGVENEMVQYTVLTMLSDNELEVTVYTMISGNNEVTFFSCTSEASAIGGQSWEAFLLGSDVTIIGEEHVYIPDMGKITCQHTLRNTVFGDAEGKVNNFTVERWAVTDGTLPLTGTVYSISTMDTGYGQSAVTVVQLSGYNLTGAVQTLTADLIAGATEIPCPY